MGGLQPCGKPAGKCEFYIETVKHSNKAYSEGAVHTSKTTLKSQLAENLCRLTYISALAFVLHLLCHLSGCSVSSAAILSNKKKNPNPFQFPEQLATPGRILVPSFLMLFFPHVLSLSLPGQASTVLTSPVIPLPPSLHLGSVTGLRPSIPPDSPTR